MIVPLAFDNPLGASIILTETFWSFSCPLRAGCAVVPKRAPPPPFPPPPGSPTHPAFHPPRPPLLEPPSPLPPPPAGAAGASVGEKIPTFFRPPLRTAPPRRSRQAVYR